MWAQGMPNTTEPGHLAPHCPRRPSRLRQAPVGRSATAWWLAELGGLRDPALLVAKVVRSLGLPDQSGRWAMVTLVDHLRARQVLLVID